MLVTRETKTAKIELDTTPDEGLFHVTVIGRLDQFDIDWLQDQLEWFRVQVRCNSWADALQNRPVKRVL